jgi:hypothetical protein
MSGEIAIDCGGLQAQAADVERVARSLDDPINAISYMTLGSDAYGLMCGFAAIPTTVMGLGAQASLIATRALLERAAALARLVASDFEERESQYCTEIRELEAELDGLVYV